MKSFIIISLLWLIVNTCFAKDIMVISYFRKIDASGNFIHREESIYDDKLPKPFITTVTPEDINSGAVLKVTPVTVNNGGNVTVRWAGVTNPSENDFIAFYCPGNDKPTHYLDYFHVTEDKGWSSGSGQYTVYVYNMRTLCRFKYFRSSKMSQLVAVSNLLAFTNGALQPLQGHLALTGFPNEMRVMWVSGKTDEKVSVIYGTTVELDQSENRHNVSTYAADSLCEAPANSTGYWHPGYIYDVLLTNLKPNTKYYYSYGNYQVMSPVHTFTTAIPAGDATPYKFIAYGDMGIDPYPQGKSTSKHVVNDIVNDEKYRFVFHNGDISYALGFSYIWEEWFALIEPISTRVPYMVGIGNHEYDHQSGGEHDPSGAAGEGFRPAWGNMGDDSHGECGVPMYHRFHMPDTGFKLWWYSYDYGLVHYVMMSTEHDFTHGSKQYQWIENDLKSVDHKKTPWIIFGGHRAMYTSCPAPGDYVVSLNMQRILEDLLYLNKVDLALWAHYHNYERTCKVYKQKCHDDGIVNIVVGTAGRDADPDIWFKKSWSIYRNINYGYGRVSIISSTAMYWEWVENSSGKVLDSVRIFK